MDTLNFYAKLLLSEYSKIMHNYYNYYCNGYNIICSTAAAGYTYMTISHTIIILLKLGLLMEFPSRVCPFFHHKVQIFHLEEQTFNSNSITIGYGPLLLEVSPIRTSMNVKDPLSLESARVLLQFCYQPSYSFECVDWIKRYACLCGNLKKLSCQRKNVDYFQSCI